MVIIAPSRECCKHNRDAKFHSLQYDVGLFCWSPPSRSNRIDGCFRSHRQVVNDKPDVCFWSKQTVRKTQSMSLLGVKRTWPIAVHMSAYGPKRTCVAAPHMSAFGGKADMTSCGSRFRGRYWG